MPKINDVERRVVKEKNGSPGTFTFAKDVAPTRFHAFARVDCNFVLGYALPSSPLVLALLIVLFSAIPGSISEGSRTTLFGSSTSVAVFSPITARRTTVERREGSETVAREDGAGSNARFANCQSTILAPSAPVVVGVFVAILVLASELSLIVVPM